MTSGSEAVQVWMTRAEVRMVVEAMEDEHYYSTDSWHPHRDDCDRCMSSVLAVRLKRIIAE